MTKREPVLLPLAILTGLQLFFGGLSGIMFLQDNQTVGAVAALGILAVTAAQGGIMFYIRGQVTPTEDAISAGADPTVLGRRAA